MAKSWNKYLCRTHEVRTIGSTSQTEFVTVYQRTRRSLRRRRFCSLNAGETGVVLENALPVLPDQIPSRVPVSSFEPGPSFRLIAPTTIEIEGFQ